MESDLYRRLIRWLFALCGACVLMLMFFWMIGLRFQATPWDYHLARFCAGKTKATLMINDSVRLCRTRSAVGLHLQDGTPVVPGVINRLGYDPNDKQQNNILWVAFSTAPYTYVGTRTFGDTSSLDLVARLNLAKKRAILVEDPVGVKQLSLESVLSFFPLSE